MHVLCVWVLIMINPLNTSRDFEYWFLWVNEWMNECVSVYIIWVNILNKSWKNEWVLYIWFCMFCFCQYVNRFLITKFILLIIWLGSQYSIFMYWMHIASHWHAITTRYTYLLDSFGCRVCICMHLKILWNLTMVR